jgi:hypothetical protein
LLINQDYENLLSMSVFGKNNLSYRPGGKISFGDFGGPAYYGCNAWIGELDNTDTDALELGGRNGISLKSGGTMSYEIAKFTSVGDLYLRGSLLIHCALLVA